MMDTSQRKVYRLSALADWEMSRVTGFLPANADDIRDGFLHLCLSDQIPKIGRKYYQHVPDLQVLGIFLDSIKNILRVESNSEGELFPHAYGQIARADVLFARPVPLVDGKYVFPYELFQ